MDLESLIVQVLADAPTALTSHQIAKECRHRFSGNVPARLSGQHVHVILSGPLRPLVSVTPSYKWSLLSLESNRAMSSPAVSGDPTGNYGADRLDLSDAISSGGPEVGRLHNDSHEPDTECPGAFLILDDDEWLCD